MATCTNCGGASVTTKVVPSYEVAGLGAPFKVILEDAVKVTSCAKGLSLGNRIGIKESGVR